MEHPMRNQAPITDRSDFEAATRHVPLPLQLQADAEAAQRAIDDMLNEALMDSFPASDPISSLRFV
jgi:hypothetical protein